MAHRFPGRPPGLSPSVLTTGTPALAKRQGRDKRQAEQTSQNDKPKDKTNKQAEQTSRKDKTNLKLQGTKDKPKDKPNLKLPANRFPGRPPGSSDLSAFSFQGSSRQDKPNDKATQMGRPYVLTGTPALAERHDERQAEKTSRQDERQDKRQDERQDKLPEMMAHCFPGRPPGSDDDSFSSVVSSIHDYIDGTEAFLGFEDADHFHRLASEFFDDDDSFWSIHHHLQQEQHHPGHLQTEAPTTTGPLDLHCLVPSQVYKAQTSQRATSVRNSTFKPNTVPHTVQFDYYNPTVSDPSGLRKDMYSQNDIRHYFGPVCSSPDVPYQFPFRIG